MGAPNETPAGTPAGAAPGETPAPAAPTNGARGTSTGEPIGQPSAAPAAKPEKPAAQPPAAPPQKPRVFSFTKDKLDERLEQAKRAKLRDLFGTDDEGAIRERLDNFTRLEKESEERRLASLSEVERAKEEAKQALARAERAEREAAAERERREVDQTRVVVERAASKHVNQRYVPEASLAYARHLSKLSPQQLSGWKPEDADEWFAKYAQEHREIAASARAPRVEKTPAGSATPPATPPKSQTPPSRTFKPGGGMTRAEALAEARKLGYEI